MLSGGLMINTQIYDPYNSKLRPYIGIKRAFIYKNHLFVENNDHLIRESTAFRALLGVG